ncbi:prepilin peptidase [Actinotalea sp. BY-33]|uniref:Prepilin leader peptidase/N-methyltransferase n=1 Tax=Actinotalea soli TaxID=2819234 RepID=A0A939LMU6_9CELL|nr:A24 family peptidase [Actinotalea soli]MBO1750451.1 prepilin peptidase [Actinotalea soli]
MTDLPVLTGPTLVAAHVLIGLLGLLIGSFLNVVAWRVPRRESIVSPPSACPQCGHALRRRDNIPVLSWLVLRGRCRDCGAPISRRYPLVELATAVLFVLVSLRFGVEAPGVWALPAFLYLAAVGLVLTVIDIDVHRLPDVIVLPSYGVTVVLLAVASWATGEWGSLLRAGIGGLILFLLYFLLLVVYPRGMGFGDVKLAGVLGLCLAWLGWGALVIGAFSAFLVGGAFAVGLVLAGRAGRKSGIPFGPWMVAGAAIGIAWGDTLWSAYLGLIL